MRLNETEPKSVATQNTGLRLKFLTHASIHPTKSAPKHAIAQHAKTFDAARSGLLDRRFCFGLS
jgi:hypothetical protein